MVLIQEFLSVRPAKTSVTPHRTPSPYPSPTPARSNGSPGWKDNGEEILLVGGRRQGECSRRFSSYSLLVMERDLLDLLRENTRTNV